MSHVPPYQDITTLAGNLCISEATVDEWLRLGLLPPPRQIRRKRLWKWAEVVECLDGSIQKPPSPEAESIRYETQKAVRERAHR